MCQAKAAGRNRVVALGVKQVISQSLAKNSQKAKSRVPKGVTKVLAITNIHTEIGVRLAGRARAAGCVRAMDPLGLSSELIRGLHVDMRRGPA